MKAIVYKSTGSWYAVKIEDGERINARVKGIFRMNDITSTNPVAVGDEVDIEMENNDVNNAVISKIYDRKNYIARTTPHHAKTRHIVASNLDSVLLFATLKQPQTSQGFTDRLLAAAEAYHVPAVIAFNKADLYKKKEMQLFEERKEMYNSIGYKVLLTSLKDKEGIEELQEVLQNKVTLLAGHSGVGKSTFINSIYPDLMLRTNNVSGWSGKGMHTTTFAEMFDLPYGGKIIDTPGLREFGLTDIPKQELSHYFPEMREVIQNCQFNNCLHIAEPGCAVKQNVEEGTINLKRYISYCNILESIDEKTY